MGSIFSIISQESIMNPSEFQLVSLQAGTPIYLKRQQNSLRIRAGEEWEDHWLYLAYDLEIGAYSGEAGKVQSPYRFIPRGTRFQGTWKATSRAVRLHIHRIFFNGGQEIKAISEPIGEARKESRVSLRDRQRYGRSENTYLVVDPREIVVYLKDDFIPWPVLETNDDQNRTLPCQNDEGGHTVNEIL